MCLLLMPCLLQEWKDVESDKGRKRRKGLRKGGRKEVRGLEWERGKGKERRLNKFTERDWTLFLI